jgi:hypothetical protein
MMTDRELLELAAKAMGEKVPPRFYPDGSASLISGARWNPLADDGDALRLAVKLGLYIDGKFTAHQDVHEFVEFGELAAVRRAIVRAAAEIGRTS